MSPARRGCRWDRCATTSRVSPNSWCSRSGRSSTGSSPASPRWSPSPTRDDEQSACWLNCCPSMTNGAPRTSSGWPSPPEPWSTRRSGAARRGIRRAAGGCRAILTDLSAAGLAPTDIEAETNGSTPCSTASRCTRPCGPTAHTADSLKAAIALRLDALAIERAVASEIRGLELSRARQTAKCPRSRGRASYRSCVLPRLTDGSCRRGSRADGAETR